MMISVRSIFSELVGKTLIDVKVDEKNHQISFETNDGIVYEMYHEQDCCEDVNLSDVIGDWNDIINTEILVAEENTDDDEYNSLWTFYKIRTIKGTIDIRWVGYESYYAVGVSFFRLEDEKTYNEKRENLLIETILKIEEARNMDLTTTSIDIKYNYDLLIDLKGAGYKIKNSFMRDDPKDFIKINFDEKKN